MFRLGLENGALHIRIFDAQRSLEKGEGFLPSFFGITEKR